MTDEARPLYGKAWDLITDMFGLRWCGPLPDATGTDAMQQWQYGCQLLPGLHESLAGEKAAIQMKWKNYFKTKAIKSQPQDRPQSAFKAQCIPVFHITSDRGYLWLNEFLGFQEQGLNLEKGSLLANVYLGQEIFFHNLWNRSGQHSTENVDCVLWWEVKINSVAVLMQFLAKEQSKEAASLAQNTASSCILGGVSEASGQNIQK